MRKLLYGSVALLSERCPVCGDESFVRDGLTICCGAEVVKPPNRWKRMSTCRDQRKHFTPEYRAALVDSQNGLCFWCGIRFDKQEWRRGRQAKKTINVEHVEPFVFASNESNQNIVASCSICNSIKSSLIFQDIHEARTQIQLRRTTKGYTTTPPRISLRDLRDAVPEA